MKECEITASVTALAELISGVYNDDELALLSAVLVQLGDTIATILAYRILAGK